MVGFWPHPRYAKYHSKETPCKEKLNLHGNFLVYDYEKNENFCLNNTDYYNLEEFDDDHNKYNNLSFDNLYWKTKKTPYGKRVSKKVYDAEKEMFFYPKNQEIKIKNKFEPLDSKDECKVVITPEQQIDNDIHSSRNVLLILKVLKCLIIVNVYAACVVFINVTILVMRM